MSNYIFVAIASVVAFAIAWSGPLGLYRFFGGAHESEVGGKSAELREAELGTLKTHRRRRRNALLLGGLVPFGGFVIAACVGLVRVNAGMEAPRFLSGLGLYTAVFVVIFAGAQVVADVEEKYHLSRYIDLAGKMGILTTSAISVGLLLSEYGIDLVG